MDKREPRIFFLDSDPEKAAADHCDKHIVMMPLVIVQILSTSIRLLIGEIKLETDLFEEKVKRFKLKCACDKDGLYKSKYPDHEIVKWTKASVANFMWTMHHAKALFRTYTLRYGRPHKSEAILKKIRKVYLKKVQFPSVQLTVPPQCVNDSNRCIETEGWDSVVKAYRQDYVNESGKFAQWNHTTKPKWFAKMSEK